MDKHTPPAGYPNPGSWGPWLAAQVDAAESAECPVPPDPLADHPPFPYVGARDADGDFRNWGRRVFRKAVRYPYLQLNAANGRGVLLFDLDRPEVAAAAIEAGRVPRPTWLVRDTGTGRAHGGYALRTPVHLNRVSSVKASRFLADVERSLGAVLGSDPGYSGTLTRNPWFPSILARTEWGPLSGFDLADLVPQGGIVEASTGAPIIGSGRNVTAFELALVEAEALAWAIRSDHPEACIEPIVEPLRACLDRVNRGFNPPMEAREVGEILRNVMRYARRWTHAKRRGGRTGGIRSGESRREGSAEERQPWVAEGVSRPTWYRRRARVRLEGTGG